MTTGQDVIGECAERRGDPEGHLRLLARHGVRVVRLLHLRHAGAVLRGAVLPQGNATAALLASFATYAAGFLVRPFGALVFGRIGDLVGRKYTFLVTIMVMGLATAAVGFLPTYATIGMLSPTILVLLRLAQGLALGGEYGGAATYVAEHAPDEKRGLHTSWIQTTATLGFFLSLVVIGVCRSSMAEPTFKEWGWRIPFLLSLRAAGDLALHPAQAERVAGVPRDEGAGEGEQGAARGELRRTGRTSRSCCSRCSARRRGRGSSGTRGSSTRCSS